MNHDFLLKGTMKILKDLEKDRKNFTKLTMGLNRRTTSKRLVMLEASGLINREVTQDRPLRVYYSLTEKGRKLLEVLK